MCPKIKRVQDDVTQHICVDVVPYSGVLGFFLCFGGGHSRGKRAQNAHFLLLPVLFSDLTAIYSDPTEIL